MPAAESTLPSLPALPANWESTNRKWIVLACFIGDVQSQVACVVERETKPWKKEGQTWIVFETLELWEEPNEAAIFRALHEELDLTGAEVVDWFEEKGEFFLCVEQEKGKIVFDVKVFLVKLKVGTRIANIVGHNAELQSRGMREVSSLNWDTRPGTILALQMAIGSHDGYFMPPIIHVRDGEEVQPNS